MSKLAEESSRLADRDPRSAVMRWLAQGRFALPTDFNWVVNTSPQGAIPPIPPEADGVYTSSDVDFHSLPSGEMLVSWRRAPAHARIAPEAPQATLVVSPSALEVGHLFFRRFLVCVLAMTLKRAGLYHLHGATLRDPEGGGWLLVGASHSGKSTTTAALAERGWGVGTDDIAFVHRVREHSEVLAWYERIALREGGLRLIQAVGGTPIPERGKLGYFPEELGAAWVPTIRPAYILFPELADRTTLTQTSPAEAMRAVLRQSNWILFERHRADEYLDTLRRLVTQATCFRLQLAPDLFERPGALKDLLP